MGLDLPATTVTITNTLTLPPEKQLDKIEDGGLQQTSVF
jgi:hypothetical protein